MRVTLQSIQKNIQDKKVKGDYNFEDEKKKISLFFNNEKEKLSTYLDKSLIYGFNFEEYNRNDIIIKCILLKMILNKKLGIITYIATPFSEKCTIQSLAENLEDLKDFIIYYRIIFGIQPSESHYYFSDEKRTLIEELKNIQDKEKEFFIRIILEKPVHKELSVSFTFSGSKMENKNIDGFYIYEL